MNHEDISHISQSKSQSKSILFVCTGNICRSPIAEGIAIDYLKKHQLNNIKVDSAGTHNYHAGEKYDLRTLNILAKHGIDLSKKRSRQITKDDFSNFDLILYADKFNLECIGDLFMRLPDKVLPMTCYSEKYKLQNIPDPYYREEKHFEIVYNMLLESTYCLMKVITD